MTKTVESLDIRFPCQRGEKSHEWVTEAHGAEDLITCQECGEERACRRETFPRVRGFTTSPAWLNCLRAVNDLAAERGDPLPFGGRPKLADTADGSTETYPSGAVVLFTDSLVILTWSTRGR